MATVLFRLYILGYTVMRQNYIKKIMQKRKSLSYFQHYLKNKNIVTVSTSSVQQTNSYLRWLYHVSSKNISKI